MAKKKTEVGSSTHVGMPVVKTDTQVISKSKLTKLEKLARREASQSIRVAAFADSFGNVGSQAISNADSAFYSPQLSTDFLELPQSEREKRELYRFWYNSHPLVGAAIDFHCFPPGAPVLMVDGTIKFIETLEIGDGIINGLGEPTKVVQTFQHQIHGPVTRLTVRGVQSTFDCTENHPFLVYRAEQIDCKLPVYGIGACKNGSKFICKQKKCDGLEFGEPQFVFAKDLKEGDYICSPSMVGSKRSFNRNQLRLLGYYAAEGSLSRTIYGKLDRVVFTLNANEFNTIADEIAETFQAEYNHTSRKRFRTDSNSCEVRCYKKDFAEFCQTHVGSGSINKKLSQGLIDSPREDILEFLGAYWNGDGSLTKNGYVAKTVSKSLAYQIHALAVKVGYTPTIHAVEPKLRNNGFKSNGVVYSIIIPYRVFPEFSNYANFVKGEYRANSTREYHIRVGSNILRRIEKIDTVQYDGLVFNIEVDGEGNRKSYVAYGLATHNTDVPMSKLRLASPKGKDEKRNKQILHFYENMCRKIRLFQTLYDVTHEYWLHGVCIGKDTPVKTSYGLKLSQDIKLDDELLTHENRWKKVIAVSTRNVNKYLEFKVWKIPGVLKVTDEHPIEVLDKGNSVFKHADQILSKDFVRITWPSEISDTKSVDLLNGLNYELIDGGYRILRQYEHQRQSDAHIARTKFLNWISSLNGSVIRTRSDLAKEFGVKLFTLNNVISQLNKEIDVEFHHQIGQDGFKGGSRVEWHPIIQSLDSDKYEATNKYEYKLKTTLDIDDDMMYVIGYWLGDGSMGIGNRMTPGRGVWNICFGNQSEKQYDKIKSILEHKLGKDCLFIRTHCGIRYLVIRNNPGFINWWSKSFGCTSHGKIPKRVPSWVMNLPHSKQLSFMAGVIDSDGWITRTKCSNKGTIGIGMTSRSLIDSIRDISLRIGAVPNFNIRTPKLVNIFNGKEKITSRHFYILSFLDQKSCNLLTQKTIKQFDGVVRFNTRCSFHKLVHGKLYFKVKNISRVNKSLDVFNYTVENDHTYQANYISTHNCFPFCEDHDLSDILEDDALFDEVEEEIGEIDYAGRQIKKTEKKRAPKSDTETSKLIRKLVADKYQGWQRITILPPEQVKLEVFQYTNKIKMELIPSEKDRILVLKSQEQHDEDLAKIADDIPEQIRDNLMNGQPIPLNTDPYDDFLCSSFCLPIHHKRSPYDERGVSILERCLRTLVFQDKLRQAQTSIASRAMTPKRIVWADKMSEPDTESLREQIDQALIDPDFTIVANFEVHWDEIGSRDRLLDLSTEYEITNKLLFIGLRVTEPMLTGESTFSGERIHLDVMNTMYLLYREQIASFVEEMLFRPVAEKKNFWEEDEYGNRVLLYPKLQFTRLALRDNTELQDYMFNLYQKGSLPISFILDLLNIDSDDAAILLKKDMFTPNDSTFNEFLRNLFGKAGDMAVDKTDVLEIIAKNAGLKMTEEKGDRFSKEE